MLDNPHFHLHLYWKVLPLVDHHLRISGWEGTWGPLLLNGHHSPPPSACTPPLLGNSVPPKAASSMTLQI